MKRAKPIGRWKDVVLDVRTLRAGLKDSYPPTTPAAVRRYKTLQSQLREEELKTPNEAPQTHR